MTETDNMVKRELLWMQQPRDRSEGLPDAFGLSSTEALGGSVSCCQYCSVCRTFCICDTLDVCVIKNICDGYCFWH